MSKYKLSTKLKPATDNGSSSKLYSHLVPNETVYQMTSTDHIKELKQELLEEQNYICPLCNKKIDPTKAALDHSHRGAVQGTGLIRGVLCSGCNMYLGKLENNFIRNGLKPEGLRTVLVNTVTYLLDQPHKPFVHPDLAPLPKRLKKTSYNKLIQTYKEQNKSLADVPDYPKRQYITDKMMRAFEAVGLEPEFYKD